MLESFRPKDISVDDGTVPQTNSSIPLPNCFHGQRTIARLSFPALGEDNSRRIELLPASLGFAAGVRQYNLRSVFELRHVGQIWRWYG